MELVCSGSAKSTPDRTHADQHRKTLVAYAELTLGEILARYAHQESDCAEHVAIGCHADVLDRKNLAEEPHAGSRRETPEVAGVVEVDTA